MVAVPGVNDTRGYYTADGSPSLFWEMTVCQSLAEVDSPCQQALATARPYGRILGEWLRERIGLAPDWSVLEVGGGYGTLMSGLLEAAPLREVTMVDISPYFAARQKEVLRGHPGVRFVAADAFEYLRRPGREWDLVISNENIGDFPTVTGIGGSDLRAALDDGGSGPLGEVAGLVTRYGLDLRDAPGEFHFNLGALRYLEVLRPVAKHVFLSEHGSDTVVPPPYAEFMACPPGDGYPRRIRLKGHDEYTIKFGHLEQAARGLGYTVERCHMAEMLGVRTDAGIRFMAGAKITTSEVAEAVHEFCAHVAEYQCMVLKRP